MDSLIHAYKSDNNAVDITKSAIVIDSSSFLRLGSQVDVIDYLNANHTPPIILPGQSIQEFWNNHLNVVDSISQGIAKKFDQLKSEIEKVDNSFSDFSNKFSELLDEFKKSYGYAYDGATVRRTLSFLELLRNKAITSYVTRDRFSNIAHHRKKTKTPPGFKDDGDGDFYVWLDTLDSLILAKSENKIFSDVILITNDRKLDWSRDGIAHPILRSEVKSLVGTNFETWDTSRLVKEVAKISS